MGVLAIYNKHGVKVADRDISKSDIIDSLLDAMNSRPDIKDSVIGLLNDSKDAVDSVLLLDKVGFLYNEDESKTLGVMLRSDLHLVFREKLLYNMGVDSSVEDWSNVGHFESYEEFIESLSILDMNALILIDSLLGGD